MSRLSRVVYGKRQTSTNFSHLAMFQSAQPRIALSDGTDSENSGIAGVVEEEVDALSKGLRELQVREKVAGSRREDGPLATIHPNANKVPTAKPTKALPEKQEANVSKKADAPAKSARAQREQSSQASTKASKARQRNQEAKVHESDEVTRSIKQHIAPLAALCTANNRTADACPAPYQDWADSLEPYFTVSKIAEASYGEVYRLSLKRTQAGFAKNDESVVKIIPVTPPPALLTHRCKKVRSTGAVSTSQMSEPADVASETRLLQRMTAIPGFTNFRDLRIVQGRPPAIFANAWKTWNKAQPAEKKSLFPDPMRKSNYAETQLWAVVEMQDAGTDLETQPCRDVWAAWDLFWGVAVALAKGEEGARFEHRDLHLGNVCVKPSGLSQGSKDRRKRDCQRKLGFSGLETTIIDYTLSRADVDSEKREGQSQVAYLDLEKDLAIFAGDASVEYQYEIYRYMRGIVLHNDSFHPRAAEPQQSGDSNAQPWQKFCPRTNLVWLHYLLYEICRQVDHWPSEQDEKNWINGNWDIAVKLEDRLLDLQDLLQVEELQNTWKIGDGEPDNMEQSSGQLNSAADLVALAIQEGWLDVDDVVGLGVPTSPVVLRKSRPEKKLQRRKKAY